VEYLLSVHYENVADNLIDNAFSQLETDGKSGSLTTNILKNGGYGISSKHPGYISKYDKQGRLIAIWHYRENAFWPTEIFVK